jgi:NAD(P)H dehydrogenase (quinone)
MKRKIVVILGHSDENSLCATLYKTYLKKADTRKNIEIRTINLSQITFNPILKHGYNKIQPLEKDLEKAQEDILWAEHIVLFFPTWWSAPPAILKGFFDRVFLPGFAFKYTGPIRWKRLLKGRTAELIVTMGGPTWFYRIIGNAAIKSLKYGTLLFCGIRTKKTIWIGNASNMKKEKVESWKRKIRKLID